MNESHQQSSHKTWRTSVKTQETNLESKKNCKALEFSAKKNLEEDEDGEEMSGREWEKENAKICLNFPLLIGLYKKKVKSKIFLTLREITK